MTDLWGGMKGRQTLSVSAYGASSWALMMRPFGAGFARLVKSWCTEARYLRRKARDQRLRRAWRHSLSG